MVRVSDMVRSILFIVTYKFCIYMFYKILLIGALFHIQLRNLIRTMLLTLKSMSYVYLNWLKSLYFFSCLFNLRI